MSQFHSPVTPGVREHRLSHPTAIRWLSSGIVRRGLTVAHIYLKLIGTDEPVRLTRDESDDLAPTWSPDGRFIAIRSSLAQRPEGCVPDPAYWRSRAKGGRSLLRRPASFLGSRGTRVASGSSWGTGKLRTETRFCFYSRWTMARNEDSPPALPGEFWSDCSPAVSPDGRAVAFARMVREGIGDLFLLELSEDLKPISAPRRLTFLNQYTTSPVWTPDGRAIVFASGTPHSPTLYKIVSFPMGMAARQTGATCVCR